MLGVGRYMESDLLIASKRSPEPDRSAIERSGVSVLIVDDSKLVAERLATMLTAASAKIRVIGHARNLAEGKMAIDRANPDVVILDIRMPGGSGIVLLDEVKRRRSPPVVIVLTNYPTPQYRKHCIKAGADYFLDKSAQFDQVVEILLALPRGRKGYPGAGDPG
jgi:two-component system, NarL family, response regulator DevR